MAARSWRRLNRYSIRRGSGHMLVMDGTVGASDRAFDVSEGGIDPLESGRQGSAAARLCDDRLMDAAGFADAGETAQPVSGNSARGFEIEPRQSGDLGAAEARHPA